MKSAQERKDEAQAKYDNEMNFPGRRELEDRRRTLYEGMIRRHIEEGKAMDAWYTQSVFALGTDKEGTIVEPVWYYDCPACAEREAQDSDPIWGRG